MKRWLALCALVAVALISTPWVADVWARSGGGGFRGGGRATREDDGGGVRSAPDDYSADAPAPDLPRNRPARPRTLYSVVRRVVLGGLLGTIFFGGAAGTIGILELLIFSGLVLLAYRALSRSLAGQQYATVGAYGVPGLGVGPAEIGVEDTRDALARGMSAVREADPSFDSPAFGEAVAGIFRRVQAAWAARDVGGAADVLTVEMRDKLSAKAARLRALGRVNHVERIAVTRVAITGARQRAGWDLVSVLIVATLVDYTTDEMGLKVLEGNPFEPVPFEERWELLRPSGAHPWRVSAIH